MSRESLRPKVSLFGLGRRTTSFFDPSSIGYHNAEAHRQSMEAQGHIVTSGRTRRGLLYVTDRPPRTHPLRTLITKLTNKTAA